MKDRGSLFAFWSLALCAFAVVACTISYVGLPAGAASPTPTPTSSSAGSLGPRAMVAFGPGPKRAFQPAPPLSLRQQARRARGYAPKENSTVSQDALGYNVFHSSADGTELFNLSRQDFVSLDAPIPRAPTRELLVIDYQLDLVLLKDPSSGRPKFCWALRESSPFTDKLVSAKTHRIMSDDGTIVIQTQTPIVRFKRYGVLPHCS